MDLQLNINTDDVLLGKIDNRTTFLKENERVEVIKYSKKNSRVARITAETIWIMLLPLTGIIALLIKLTSKGPVFYEDLREGAKGRLFKLKKFRTMTTEESTQYAGPEIEERKKQSKRITFIGMILRKFGLDELPQLINIARGEMNFLGPRARFLNETLGNPDYICRIRGVLPGILGLEQICSRRDQQGHNPNIKDRYYVMKKSLRLDLYIILMTPFFIIFKKKFW